MRAPKATEAAVAAVQRALIRRVLECEPEPDGARWCVRHESLWPKMQHACDRFLDLEDIAQIAADAAAPHIAAQAQARVADLEHRLERADHHLRLRTSALTRVLARERRERAMVVGNTAYFPGRIRQIVEEYHRRGS